MLKSCQSSTAFVQPMMTMAKIVFAYENVQPLKYVRSVCFWALSTVAIGSYLLQLLLLLMLLLLLFQKLLVLVNLYDAVVEVMDCLRGCAVGDVGRCGGGHFAASKSWKISRKHLNTHIGTGLEPTAWRLGGGYAVTTVPYIHLLQILLCEPLKLQLLTLDVENGQLKQNCCFMFKGSICLPNLNTEPHF